LAAKKTLPDGQGFFLPVVWGLAENRSQGASKIEQACEYRLFAVSSKPRENVALDAWGAK